MDVIGSAPSVRVGSVSVAGAAPWRLLCLTSREGDLLIPTGQHRELTRTATGKPVTVRFERKEPGSPARRVVRGTGHARPLARRDRPLAPAAEVSAVTALTMTYAFENGIQVRLDEVAGERVTEEQS